MITLAEIVRRYGAAYRAHYHEQVLPSHAAALTAIAQCRTAALGGHVYTCSECEITRYSYHSCRNRHCPACQHGAGQRWLAQQQELLLPVPHFLITFTLPSELRAIARSHQRQFYNLFFRASAHALEQLAADPRFVGGQIGMLGVLQTWTRDLRYHPHIHYLVPAIGLTADGRFSRPRTTAFLIPVQALAVLFRAKMRAALRQTGFASAIPAAVWTQPWVVDCRPVGRGAAALKYLAPYIFRVALSNNRIVQLANERVTFRYIDGTTHQPKTCTLPVLAFLHRFLQHVLPRGFVKVRQFGLFSRRHRAMLAHLRAQLALVEAACGRTPGTSSDESREIAGQQVEPREERCPVCGRRMQVSVLAPQRNRGPPDANAARQRKAARIGQSAIARWFMLCYNHKTRREACRRRTYEAKQACGVSAYRTVFLIEDERARLRQSTSSGNSSTGPRLITKGICYASASFNED